MKVTLTIILIVMIAFLGFAIYDYGTKWGSLDGEVVIEGASENVIKSVHDMNIYLILPEIKPFLDSLSVYYDKKVAPLEDSVSYYRILKEEYIDLAREEEIIFRVTLGNADPASRIYRQNKIHLDSVFAERDSIENIFNNFRSELLDGQNGYNGVIAQLIDNKLLLKAQVNGQGKFRFPKLENGDYYLYSLLILSGDQDVTRIPAEMYHIYALSGNLIKKYSWMVNVTVQENTAIRLDAQNTSDIFK